MEEKELKNELLSYWAKNTNLYSKVDTSASNALAVFAVRWALKNKDALEKCRKTMSKNKLRALLTQ